MRVLALTGHRGRVNARGRPLGKEPGLTRTTHRSAVAPSRDGRRRCAFGDRAGTACLRQATDSPRERNSTQPPQALRPRRSREGARAPRSVVRVRPGAPHRCWPRASSRPRWPDEAKDQPKERCWFFSTHRAAPRQGGQGFGAQARAQCRGQLVQCGRLLSAALPRRAVTSCREPSKSGRPGRI